ncbi:MAG: EAL domain-containing protein [Neptuniibacter sp.]
MSQPKDIEVKSPGNIETPETTQVRVRKNVQLLFLGLSAEEIAPLLALLRTSRISPRGRKINSEKSFLDSLSERSWDLILCSPTEGKFTGLQAVRHLKRLGKDIPVIQLISKADNRKQLQCLKNRINAVVPFNERELILLQVQKELENLENRRQLRKSEAALAEAEKRNIQLMESSKHAIAYCSEQLVVYANESFLDLFGEIEMEQAQSKKVSERFLQNDGAQLKDQITELQQGNYAEQFLQLTAIRSDQSEFSAHVELSSTLYKEKPVVQMLLRVDDLNIGNAYNDDLNLVSGLLNKHLLYQQLETIIQRALSGGNDCSLLYIVLDHYNPICQELRQETGDRLIRNTASLLKKLVVKPHLLFHLEDNIFAVIFFDPSVDKTQKFAARVCKRISQNKLKIANQELQSTCSIGITLINDNSPPTDEILSRAAYAARNAKEDASLGENVSLFSSSTPFELDNDEMKRVCRAVEAKELKLLFQPVVNLANENQTEQHYEVLLRMLEEDQVEISPNDFRNAMSDPDTVIKVDRWVIERSLLLLKETLGSNQKNVLFINISVHSIEDKKLLLWLSELLEDHKIPPEQIVFQISNSDVAIAPKQARFFAKFLHKIHCRICIKHFGSAPYDREVLKKINADYIKLDGLYIQELGKDERQDEQFFQLVKGLSDTGKITIAPLVEDTRAMVTLWKAGVGYVQGYYLQPPREKMDYDFFAK